MNVMTANIYNVEMFSKVLVEAAEWLSSINQTMWNTRDLSVQKLLESYKLDEMKLCYENNNLIGVYVIQWYDPLFWPELKENESGFLHKLAICNEYRNKGFGKRLIQSAELLCKEQGVGWLRLNCGTKRQRLRNLYEGIGFEMLDRVFIDNRDQIRYMKKLV